MRGQWVVVAFWLAVAANGSPVRAEQPRELLEKGIYQQETASDLDAAERIYRQIVEEANATRRFVAEAQYRLGICYQKQGKKAEAEAAFRQVIGSYPDQVEIAAKAMKELREGEPKILAVSKDGVTGITLEKAWILPAGLVMFRIAYEGRMPFGEAPRLADPSKNPWGLKPEEIPQVIHDGQLILDPAAPTEDLAGGGIAGRWAGYAIFQFKPSPDGKPPVKLTYRTLLGRTGRPGEEDMKVFAEHVLYDPSAWELYEFSIPTQPYLTDQVPEEIYDSPNLPKAIVLSALRRIVADYEKQSPEKALEFLNAQGPRTRELLKDELERLRSR